MIPRPSLRAYPPNYRQALQALESCHVRFILVGEFAEALVGLPDTPWSLDILVDSSETNLQALARFRRSFQVWPPVDQDQLIGPAMDPIPASYPFGDLLLSAHLPGIGSYYQALSWSRKGQAFGLEFLILSPSGLLLVRRAEPDLPLRKIRLLEDVIRLERHLHEKDLPLERRPTPAG
jgi:hypothetical protein